MDTNNPVQSPPADPASSQGTAPQEEQLVAQWVEPEKNQAGLAPRIRKRWFLGAVLIAGGFVALGVWQREFNFFFAAAITLIALVALVRQTKFMEPQLEIVITTARVVIGKREHDLSSLAGFWLQHDDHGQLIISFEQQKPSVIPASCYFPEDDQAKAREILLQVLPEVEPRNPHFSEGWSKILGN